MGDQAIKIISFTAALLGLVVIALYLTLGRARPTVVKVIKIGEVRVNVEIADTLAAQQRGLSDRPSLAADSGMLFVYKDTDTRYFWMPNMSFSLDALWIADDVVVGVQENIPYQAIDGSVPRFQSNVPVDMVLEVNAGWIDRHGIKMGDAVVQN